MQVDPLAKHPRELRCPEIFLQNLKRFAPPLHTTMKAKNPSVKTTVWLSGSMINCIWYAIVKWLWGESSYGSGGRPVIQSWYLNRASDFWSFFESSCPRSGRKIPFTTTKEVITLQSSNIFYGLLIKSMRKEWEDRSHAREGLSLLITM